VGVKREQNVGWGKKMYGDFTGRFDAPCSIFD